MTFKGLSLLLFSSTWTLTRKSISIYLFGAALVGGIFYSLVGSSFSTTGTASSDKPRPVKVKVTATPKEITPENVDMDWIPVCLLFI